MKFALLGLLLLMTACTTLSRKPASTSSENALDALLADFESKTDSARFSNSNCVEVLTAETKAVNNFIWLSVSNSALKHHGKDYIQRFWQLRLRLHSNLDSVDSQCNHAIREAFHAIRDAEDYLGEFAYTIERVNPASLDFQNQPVPIYDTKFYPPSLVKDASYKGHFEFQAGDLMIARGTSFMSAIISQVSDNHSQFSHIVFVDVDPQTKKPQTIESYLGIGVDFYEINFALKNENARLLVLRPKDSALGQAASKKIVEAVKLSKTKGSLIPYDYALDFSSHNKMSCAEVATAAYEWGSNGQIILPSQPAMVSMNNESFLRDMTLKKGPIFTPDDMETDPRFDLVLDWRDYRLIRDSRYRDAILSEMIRWVTDLNYKFRSTPKSWIAKNIVLPSRTTIFWPLVKMITGAPADLDPALPKSVLGTMNVLNQIASILLEKMYAADAEYVSQFQRPMTNAQLRSFVEALRLEDLQNFRDKKPSIIHYGLRADGGR